MRNLLRIIYQNLQYYLWVTKGKPTPPNSYVKRKLVKKAFRNSGLSTFVETGTLNGRMVEEIAPFASKVFTIELSDVYYQKAKEKFESNPTIHPLHGDSADKIINVLAELKEPSFFWLDAHYSGGDTAQASIDTPIIKELQEILSHSSKNHIIYIDDARCFDGTNDYPTLEDIKSLVQSTYSLSETRFDSLILKSKEAKPTTQ